MTNMRDAAPAILTEDEYEELGDFLAEHASLDTHGAIGLFHAVTLAPSIVMPARWLTALLPDRGAIGDRARFHRGMSLLMRQYAEVADALRSKTAIYPEEDATEECRSFARGYAAGAELDPTWRDDADRWTFAEPFALLAERFDLLTDARRAHLEEKLGPDAAAILRRQLPGLLVAARDSFGEPRERRATRPAPGIVVARRSDPSPVRVGRNDPCPCRSGKKFKRCCGSGPPPAAT